MEGMFQQMLSREREWTAESLNTLGSTVRVLVLGLDYRRLRRFRQTTPQVQYTTTRQYFSFGPHGTPTIEDCEENLAFVVDCALRVQE
jgi:hypothetical protein